ncbi:unnamed protein product, partial [Phaeothamnion confervicola]
FVELCQIDRVEARTWEDERPNRSRWACRDFWLAAVDAAHRSPRRRRQTAAAAECGQLVPGPRSGNRYGRGGGTRCNRCGEPLFLAEWPRPLSSALLPARRNRRSIASRGAEPRRCGHDSGRRGGRHRHLRRRRRRQQQQQRWRRQQRQRQSREEKQREATGNTDLRRRDEHPPSAMIQEIHDHCLRTRHRRSPLASRGRCLAAVHAGGPLARVPHPGALP